MYPLTSFIKPMTYLVYRTEDSASANVLILRRQRHLGHLDSRELDLKVIARQLCRVVGRGAAARASEVISLGSGRACIPNEAKLAQELLRRIGVSTCATGCCALHEGVLSEDGLLEGRNSGGEGGDGALVGA